MKKTEIEFTEFDIKMYRLMQSYTYLPYAEFKTKVQQEMEKLIEEEESLKNKHNENI